MSIFERLSPDKTWGGAAALAATIALANCGVAEPNSQEAERATVQTLPQAVLDDLRRGHHPVRVYDNRPSTHEDYGEYPDRERLDARCKTIGQFVRKASKHSKQWFQVNTSKQYVNAIHVRNAARLQSLPNCKK